MKRALLFMLVAGCGDLPDPFPRTPGSMSPNVGVQSVLVDGEAALPPSVTVRDHYGAAMSGITVHFSATAGGSIATQTAVTNDAGIASPGAWNVGPNTGFTKLTVTSDAFPGSTLTITAYVVAMKDVAAGGSHTCAISSAPGTGGELFCWGSNQTGQLGTTTAFGTIVNTGQRTYSSALVVIAAGTNHTCALGTFTAASCWGNNAAGQLGNGSTALTNYPSSVATAGQTFTSLAVGADHSCALIAAGNAFCWGLNSRGQVGDATTTTRLVPTAVSGSLKFTKISAGGNHTCGIATTGATYCWGENQRGQLGDGTAADRTAPTLVSGATSFQGLAPGSAHSCGLTSAGAAYCWGANDLGQLGDGTTTDRPTPAPVTGGISFTSLASKVSHTCGIATDSLAYCWGINTSGQLGDGSATTRTSPVAVSGARKYIRISAGNTHTCAVTEAGQVFCWGANISGQLGDASFIERRTPVLVRLR